MRVAVIGAGAVGGAIGAGLALAGRDVALVARGAHGAAIRARGLTLRTPEGEATVRVPCVGRVRDLGLGPDDVVVLAVKAHDAASALVDLGRLVAVACVQNGVATEPEAAARHARVLGVMAWIPGVHLEPGVVEVYAPAPFGAFRVGHYPDGDDQSARALAGELVAAGFDAEAVPDIMRWKRGKLLSNLGNVLDAFAVRDRAVSAIERRAAAEGAAVLAAAGLPFMPADELRRDMAGRIPAATIAGRTRGGGSTWQSATRGLSTEVDALNGWICRLGDEVGVATPVNRGLVRLAGEARAPRSVSIDRVRAWTDESSRGDTPA